jgi:hypothetical protein
MRKLLATAALVTSTLLLPGVVPEAHAGRHDWFAVGSAFRVGAAHISFVFGRPIHDIGPAYYFRYDRPISYRGHHCNRYCFREAGHYYHHEACPVVSAHFSNYDYDAYAAFSRYAPRYDGYDRYYDGYRDRYRSYGYRDYGGYRDRGYRDHSYRDRGYRDSYRDRSYRDRGHRDRSYRDRGYDRGHSRYDRHDRHDGRRNRGHNQRQHRHGPSCRH